MNRILQFFGSMNQFTVFFEVSDISAMCASKRRVYTIVPCIFIRHLEFFGWLLKVPGSPSFLLLVSVVCE